MALDLSGGSVGARPGSRILLWCPEASERPRVAGLERWRRAVYTACRAGFERVLIVTPHGGGLGGALAGDHRLEGRSWSVLSPDDGWGEHMSHEGGRWVVLDERWVIDADLLSALGEVEQVPAGTVPGGPLCADGEMIARWASGGWTPSDPPPERPLRTLPSPPVCVRVGDEGEARVAEDALFQGLARNVTNFFARHVDRAMSRALSRRLAPYPVTPNQITIFSTILGICGALVMLHPSHAGGALGAFLFWAHTVIDGCDGEIARLKFQESAWGAKLDLLGDNLVHAFLFPCLAGRFYLVDPDGPFLWLGALSLSGVLVTWGAVYALILHSKPTGLRLRIFETFANREFAYLLLALGLAGTLEWFVWAMAFGLWVFPAALVGAWALEGRRRHP